MTYDAQGAHDPDILYALKASLERSRALSARAEAARASARNTRRSSAATLLRLADERQARRHRIGTTPYPGKFELLGVIDGTLVRAKIIGGNLRSDVPLWRRANAVVAMGEVIGHDDRAVPASLDGDISVVAATLVRACDEVIRADLDLDDGAHRVRLSFDR
jgi:hypothetical protein